MSSQDDESGTASRKRAREDCGSSRCLDSNLAGYSVNNIAAIVDACYDAAGDGVDGYRIYKKLRAQWREEGSHPHSGVAYGEADVAAFLTLLDEMCAADSFSPKDPCSFLDIGSGIGKIVLAAAASRHFDSARGVEILKGLHNAAAAAHATMMSHHPDVYNKVKLECGDALGKDADLSSVSFLYCNCAVFTPEMLARLESICATLPKGALVLVSSPTVLKGNCRFAPLRSGKLKLIKGAISYWCYARRDVTLPKYVCSILQCNASCELLMEVRPRTAARAAGKLTCFGGKLEFSDKTAISGLLRELQEELGWSPKRSPKRVVDLYVDGELIAWFYYAEAPARDTGLKTEPGRSHVWRLMDDLIADSTLSPWHKVVLESWKLKKRRADFFKKPT